MLYILYTLLFIAALVQMQVYGGSLGWALTVMVGCVILVLVKLLGRKFIPKKVMNIISVAGAVILLVFTVRVGMTAGEGGLVEYNEKFSLAVECLSNGEYSQASSYLEDIKEQYGESDGTHVLTAIYNLSFGDTVAAMNEYNMIQNKRDRISYALLERIYREDRTQDHTQQLYQLYLQAADDHTTWSYMQFWAGVTQYEQKKYNAANYYLLHAYNLNTKSPSILYYLGAVAYAQNDYEAAQEYFNDAVAAGADENICSYIAWYLEQMEFEAAED